MQVFILTLLALAGCFVVKANISQPGLQDLTLPAGFSISEYATGIPFARSLAYNPETCTVFVSSYNFKNISGPTADKTFVWAIRDSDCDGVPEMVHKVTEGLVGPNGIDFYNGSLYVALTENIYVYHDVEATTEQQPFSAEITTPGQLPNHTWHGWRYIRVHDSKLYVAVGAPCNVPGDEWDECLDDPIFASIQQMNLDGSDMKLFASGIRNSVGMTFHPTTGEMWFTDNGRDNMKPDFTDIPPDELNHAPHAEMDFGFPYCYGKDLVDPEFNLAGNCSGPTGAVANLRAHVAALGLRFYTGDNFPAEYREADNIFIAEHGSWNRQPPQGYQITRVELDKDGKVLKNEAFLRGFLRDTPQICQENADCPGLSSCQNQPDRYKQPYYCSGWGRPADVQILNDGSLLMSDELNGKIYRITYDGSGGSNKKWYQKPGPLAGLIIGCVIVASLLGFAIFKLLKRPAHRGEEPLLNVPPARV